MLRFNRFTTIGYFIAMIGTIIMLDGVYLFGVVSIGAGFFIGCFGINIDYIERNKKEVSDG